MMLFEVWYHNGQTGAIEFSHVSARTAHEAEVMVMESNHMPTGETGQIKRCFNCGQLRQLKIVEQHARCNQCEGKYYENQAKAYEYMASWEEY